MDMKAIRQGDALGEDAVKAAAAGADLLLLTSNPDDQQRVYESLVSAIQNGKLDEEATSTSIERILSLKRWLAGNPQPDLNVVGCAAHWSVADKIAERSMTLVRNEAGLLPLNVKTEGKIAVVVPKPVDLTPADTSSYITPSLVAAMRNYHPDVDEYLIPYEPEPREVAELLNRLQAYDILVLGTLNAYASPNQTEFVRQGLKLGIPTVVAALRLPYDLMAFPEVQTYVCTYSILEPSMQALAKALFGQIPFKGRLPVSIPGLYETGYAAKL